MPDIIAGGGIVYKSDNLFAKVRYNVHNGGVEPKWRLFIKEDDHDEIMFLCNHINIYVPGQTYEEFIDGKGQYSLLYKCQKIVIDKDFTGWVM